MAATGKIQSPFSKFTNSVMRSFKTDIGVRTTHKLFSGNGIEKMNRFDKAVFRGGTILNRATGIRKPIASVAKKIFGTEAFRAKAGGVGLAVGALGMVAVGMMKGMFNASQEIVNQRYMQDQRYARNITMMSRIGYTSGTSSMNKYNHTAGLSQALSANRHGRGGY